MPITYPLGNMQHGTQVAIDLKPKCDVAHYTRVCAYKLPGRALPRSWLNRPESGWLYVWRVHGRLFGTPSFGATMGQGSRGPR